MANVVLTNDVIAEEALMVFDNNLKYGDFVHRGYEEEFGKKDGGYTKGDTISIRRPARTEVKDGRNLIFQDLTEGKLPVTVDQEKHIGFKFTSKDRSLKIADFSERFLKDPMVKLADHVDRAVAANYKYISTVAGAPGTAVDTFAKFNVAVTRATDLAMSAANRRAIMAPTDFGALQSNFTGQYSERLNGPTVGKRKLPGLSDVSVDESANAPRHVVGVATGTPRVNGANQNVTYEASPNTRTQTLNTDGWTNSTTGILKAGDVFTIADVYAVNPVSGERLDFLRAFTVEADADSGASTGPAALTISPKIITSGPYKTCSAVPADDALITVIGTGGTTYRQNILATPNWAHLTMVPVAPLEGITGSVVKSYKGLSILFTPVADAQTFIQGFRMDILYGTGPLDVEHALRFWG